MKTINWDTYYLSQCYLVSLRSIDQSTKCGAVIVSKDNRVLSQGYNGPLKNSDDTNFRTDRPYKYYVTLHAEENAILAYNGSKQDIDGSTIYVTGRPCHKCLRMIIQKGIVRVVYPKIPLTVLQTKDKLEIESFDDMVNRYNGDFRVDEIDVIDDINRCFDNAKISIDDRFENPIVDECNHEWYNVYCKKM